MSQAPRLLNEGIAAARAGNKAQARQLIRQVVELEPGNHKAWLWLAGLAESPLESVQFLEKVLAIDPAHEKARIALRAARVQAGIVAARAQDRDQTRALLRQAVAADPGNETAWMWLASVAESVADGVRYLEKVLEINPANERARAGLERYRAQLAPSGGEEQPEQAEPGERWTCPFCETLAADPAERCGGCGAILSLEHPELFFQPLQVDAEKINAALERLERADPARDGAVAWQMGLAYLNLKQPDVGLRLMRQAVALLPEAEFAAQVEALARCRDGLTPAPEAGRRKTILVVDDSPTIRKLVTMTLERRGYLTRTAGTGYEAIDVIRDWGVPDLILLDIALPGMDGYELCRLLRQNAGTTNVPIVLLSGKDGFFTKVRGRLAGCTESISKPFELEGLLRVVEHHCALDGPASVPAWSSRR